MTPVRIQRKRSKGWNMPPDTVYVGRPTKWGNPVEVTETCSANEAVNWFRRLLKMSRVGILRSMAGELYEPREALAIVLWRQNLLKSLPELRGKNLACWCPLDKPCHADVLLELANR